MKEKMTIAVTGLNATDNPGPGVTVIRSLREEPSFKGRIVGLAYDTLDPGIYARSLVDDVFLIPYPSEGVDALQARLRYINQRVGLDVILPTLDSELDAFISLEPKLREQGIGTFLPTIEQLEVRSKERLVRFGEAANITVPASRVINTAAELYTIHEQVPFPLLIKGVYYGATLAYSVDQAVKAFHQVVARWGLPVIAQAQVQGDELNVVAVGDGEGGMLGALPMKKTYITDKGKGWAGIAIADPDLIELTRRFMAASKWRGPCEVEVIKDRQGRYHLLEVNPRFPAWTFLAAGAGMNLPYLVARLAAGLPVRPLSEYKVGTMFVRIAIDQIATLEDFQALAQHGELLSA